MNSKYRSVLLWISLFVLLPCAFCSPRIRQHHAKTGPDAMCWGTDERWDECGPSCPPTCADRESGPPPFRYCPELCVPSCVCKDGFFRNRWNVCVEPERCS